MKFVPKATEALGLASPAASMPAGQMQRKRSAGVSSDSDDDFAVMMRMHHQNTLGASGAARRRSALVITDTELRLIASAAIIGVSSQPVNG
jgi:uncharacterized protein (DUF305 family)